MAASASRASRLRQTLRSLRDGYRGQIDALLPLRQLVKGSVYELHTRCGKPSCHCAAGKGPLHSAPVISWSEGGRTRLRTLPPGETALFRRATGNYRRFRQARAALGKLHRRILAHIDRLEAALELPPPKPAARRRRKRR